MITIAVRAAIDGQVDSVAAFQLLMDFERYPEQASAVREVRVVRGESRVTSEWAVNFRGGILRWKETDFFDLNGLRIEFSQIEGDLQSFDGAWSVREKHGRVEVDFDAEVELGIPSLATLLEPAAERALVQTIQEILRGLFGSRVKFVWPLAVAGASSSLTTKLESRLASPLNLPRSGAREQGAPGMAESLPRLDDVPS